MQSGESTNLGEVRFEEAIAGFEQHGLEQASKLSLMHRIDIKYLLPLHLLPKLLQQMQKTYSALQVNNRNWHEYETIYFDTPNFDFYMQHHNKRLNRPKVRYRIYNQSSSAFLEVKFKDSKKRTKKRRLQLACISEITQRQNQDFLTESVDRRTVEQLLQVLSVQYSRMSFMSMAHAERVSVDIGLRAHGFSTDKVYELRDYAVVELKQSRLNRESPVFEMMRASGCRPVSFSKYCISCAVLFPDRLRTNRFKWLLNRLSANLYVQPRGLYTCSNPC